LRWPRSAGRERTTALPPGPGASQDNMSVHTFTLTKDATNRLVLHRPDQPDIEDVLVRRAFPWSNPQQHISIRGGDGRELVHVEHLSQVPEPTRRLIEDALSSSIFVPRIQRIDSVDVSFGYQRWKVHTDRGPTEFRVQEREDIRFLSDRRFSIRDVDGKVY